MVCRRACKTIGEIYLPRNQNLAIFNNAALTQQALSLIAFEILCTRGLGPTCLHRARSCPSHTRRTYTGATTVGQRYSLAKSCLQQCFALVALDRHTTLLIQKSDFGQVPTPGQKKVKRIDSVLPLEIIVIFFIKFIDQLLVHTRPHLTVADLRLVKKKRSLSRTLLLSGKKIPLPQVL